MSTFKPIYFGSYLTFYYCRNGVYLKCVVYNSTVDGTYEQSYWPLLKWTNTFFVVLKWTNTFFVVLKWTNTFFVVLKWTNTFVPFLIHFIGMCAFNIHSIWCLTAGVVTWWADFKDGFTAAFQEVILLLCFMHSMLFYCR